MTLGPSESDARDPGIKTTGAAPAGPIQLQRHRAMRGICQVASLLGIARVFWLVAAIRGLPFFFAEPEGVEELASAYAVADDTPGFPVTTGGSFFVTPMEP